MYWQQSLSLSKQELKNTLLRILVMNKSYWCCGITSNLMKSLPRETQPNGVTYILSLVDIGFQDANPATDFRGAGYLGLLNLVEYTKTEQGLDCFKTAMDPSTHFFFCSAGLFMTLLCTTLIK
jgi:hypothetical protein